MAQRLLTEGVSVSVRIINGDCRDVLPTLPSDSFDCCVSSPPYYGLRDYGVAGQIGLEPTMQAYLETMVAVCEEVRRVLKPEGTFWLNVGDSYAMTTKGSSGKGDKQCSNAGTLIADRSWSIPQGLKAKDLCLIPNRLAIMLQERGWYVRSEIIWAKPNPMPESVRDRPTCAHEKVWLLTKQQRYFYDADAIAEEAEGVSGGASKKHIEARSAAQGRKARDIGLSNGWAGCETRNARNVWSIASQPYSGAHFATMPPALAERCIKAGCPVGGTVLDPFGGAGTTGLVADRLGRHATLIELNPEYRSLASSRVADDAPLFAEVS